MKITKGMLKRLIKEELDNLTELETVGIPDEPSRLSKVGGRATAAVKSKTEAGSGELALRNIKAELDDLKGDARISGIANVLHQLDIGKEELKLLVPKA